MAGIKTGNLFPCSCESRERLWQEVRELNQRLVPKGLCLLPLRCSEHRALLYLYRPEFLRQDLQDRQAEMLLRQAGYRELRFARDGGGIVRAVIARRPEGVE